MRNDKAVAACVALTLALVGCTVSAASALTWTPTRELPGRYTDVDVPGPPPAAVNRRGDVAVSWIGEAGGSEIAVGSRRRPGGLSRPVSMPRNFSGIPELAVTPDGRAIVGWADVTDDEFTPYYAIVSRQGKAGPARRVDRNGFNQPAPAAQPSGSVIAVYSASDSRGRPVVRALRISSSGAPGRRTTLGRARDDTGYAFFESAPGGQIIVCCAKVTSGRSGVWTYAPSRGWSTVSMRLSRGESVASVSTAAGAYVVETNKNLFVVRGGRAAAVAVPPGIVISAAGLDARGRLVATTSEREALRAWTSEPGGSTLAQPSPLGSTRDARTGPVLAAWAQGSLLAWTDRRRWRVATQRAGAFLPAPAPTGVVGHPGLASAGGAAVLSWYDDNHHAFVSIGRP